MVKQVHKYINVLLKVWSKIVKTQYNSQRASKVLLPNLTVNTSTLDLQALWNKRVAFSLVKSLNQKLKSSMQIWESLNEISFPSFKISKIAHQSQLLGTSSDLGYHPVIFGDKVYKKLLEVVPENASRVGNNK